MANAELITSSSIGNFIWDDNWARIPSGTDNGRTHAVAGTRDGKIIVFNQANPAVLIFNADGELVSKWGDYGGAHGMTLIEENGRELLWLVDQNSCAVVKTTLEGEILLTLEAPKHPVYESGARYVPTWASQNPVTGEVWVGDGYGAHLVHRFSAQGKYLSSIDGTTGVGKFKEPHGLHFTMGKAGPELFITDRCNHRIVVYDGEGNFLRSTVAVHSPCGFYFKDNLVVVAQLFTGVSVLDKETLQVVGDFGASSLIKPRTDGNWWPPQAPEGWPNLAGTDLVRPGYFNSPHGACFDSLGNIYVVEWIVGGRITRLRKVS